METPSSNLRTREIPFEVLILCGVTTPWYICLLPPTVFSSSWTADVSHQRNYASRDVISAIMWLQFAFYFLLLFGVTTNQVDSSVIEGDNLCRLFDNDCGDMFNIVTRSFNYSWPLWIIPKVHFWYKDSRSRLWDTDFNDKLSWHDDVIKWKHVPRYWPFVRGIHRSPVNSTHKGQWRGALMFSLICDWINDWVNTREAGDLNCYRAHCDVTGMGFLILARRDPTYWTGP